MPGEELLELLKYAIAQFTIIEAVAVFFGVLYIFLAARENIWCWGAALVSVLLYIYICIKAQLYAETGLQIFYLVMAVYGYFQWRKGGSNRKEKNELPITTWPLKIHAVVIISGAILVFGLGYFLVNYTNAQLPFLDSFTTIFSMITTYMVTRKKLENWLYWIIIDGAAVYLYIQRDLFITALLFLFYTIIVIFGYFQWLKIYRQQA
ncbi:MAG: nicotinamide riboside transporter PnuC [Cyclobacteriaceae bacterium]